MARSAISDRSIEPYDTRYPPKQTQPMTFEEFLVWDDGSDRNFELIDGISMPLAEPNNYAMRIGFDYWQICRSLPSTFSLVFK